MLKSSVKLLFDTSKSRFLVPMLYLYKPRCDGSLALSHNTSPQCGSQSGCVHASCVYCKVRLQTILFLSLPWNKEYENRGYTFWMWFSLKTAFNNVSVWLSQTQILFVSYVYVHRTLKMGNNLWFWYHLLSSSYDRRSSVFWPLSRLSCHHWFPDLQMFKQESLLVIYVAILKTTLCEMWADAVQNYN